MVRIDDNGMCASFWSTGDRDTSYRILREAGSIFARHLNGRMGTAGRVLVAADVRDMRHIVKGFAEDLRGGVTYAPFWFNEIQYVTSIIEARKFETLVILSPLTLNPFKLSIMIRTVAERCAFKKIVIMSVVASNFLDNTVQKSFTKRQYSMTEMFYMETAVPGTDFREDIWRDERDMEHIPECFKKK